MAIKGKVAGKMAVPLVAPEKSCPQDSHPDLAKLSIKGGLGNIGEEQEKTWEVQE